ncbi:hypothetical protein LZK98_11545 [Sphingomonas cannabina]|uniref:phage tail tube protein n=1 Tax=Sphingomonas cannabina TaxID=2899123 RepID=UPI001F2A21A7|nr:phage tail tube protein [Sphingomonas cannabina]UIJ43724.1 hypothetical protein LZK98_11545 [Sphingomonas cannabina]
MPETQAMIGYGTRVFMQATPEATVLTELGEVTNVGLPNEQRAKVQATHYMSPEETHEYISGLIDPGDAPMTINWVPGKPTDTLLSAAKADGKRRLFRVVPPGGRQYTYPVIVTGKAPAIPIDDKMTCEMTLGIAGAVVEVAAFADPTQIEEAP